ncbi:MAG: peptidylprolyl isomerase [Bdellovibrionaceae bacterium]|nr:peptidylprolyl isomerase [Pseudobdellovibrionaceae bacterium]
MRFKWIILIGVGSFLYSIGSNAETVATVGNKTITLDDFKVKYEDIKKQAINPPEPKIFLEDLIRYEVGVQEAEKLKLAEDPIVKEELRKVIYKALIEKSIGTAVENIKINENEMRKYYRKNPEIRTSHILVEIKPGATAKQIGEAEKRAKEIYDEVRRSKRPFEELVKLYTDDNISKEMGGDIGYQSIVTLVPTYYTAAMNMKVGETKGLIRTRYGFHIIKLTGRREYSQANKRQIRAAVFDEKRKELFDKYFDGLKRKYTIKKNEQALTSIK